MGFKIKYGRHLPYQTAPGGKGSKNRSAKICEDVYIADITVKSSFRSSAAGKKQISRNDAYIDYSKDPSSKENYIVLILESPHKDEYDPSLAKPLPAQGRTGDNICIYFVDMLNNANGHNKRNLNVVNGIYKLALVESVNYQCSEGNDIGNGTIRDDNWIKYYSRDASINLVKKLDYFISNSNNPIIVINACTNSTKKHLQKYVERTILGLANSHIDYFCTQHPCSWSRRKVFPYLK